MSRAAQLRAVTFLLLTLAGCDRFDPLTRADLWHPMGANAQNIAAEVANPADLAEGREATRGDDGQLADAAVQRLRLNRLKPLPDSSTTEMHTQAASGGSGGGT
jgi:hypothetical protein